MLTQRRKKQQKVCHFIEQLDPKLFSHDYYLQGLANKANFNLLILNILFLMFLLWALTWLFIDSLISTAVVDLSIFTVVLVSIFWLSIKRNDSLVNAKKSPYKLMNYLEKKSQLSSIFMDLIVQDASLRNQKKMIDLQQIHPLDYHEFLLSLTKKFYEIQRLEKDLQETQEEVSSEVKVLLNKAQRAISLKITQAHIDALIEKNKEQEGFLRFYKPKMPYSEAHKEVGENTKDAA